MSVLGIDLGTTNSVVAIADGQAARVITDPDGNRLIPSCVSFPPEGTILVGHAARERRLVDAENTVYSIKRLIGRPFASPEVQRAKERFPFALEGGKSGGVQVRTRRGEYSLPEISAMVLRHLRKVAELALGSEVKRAVITVPANFNELQRSATQAAGKVAGLEIMRILNEPTAATLAYGYGKDKPETVAVYDLGGGTFDITILHLDGDVFEVVSTAGDTFLGGDDVDLAITERMVEECQRAHQFDARTEPQAFERMRAAAEWAKCQLSGVTEAELTLEELFVDRSGKSVDFRFVITRAELEARIRPLVARSFDVVAEGLREAGKRPKEIDSVVMVGGSTRIPLVRAMVAEHFGKPPRVDIDPDLVVAQGAAIHAWTLAGRPAVKVPRPQTMALGGGTAPPRKFTVADPAAARLAARPRGPAFAPEESPLRAVMPLGPQRIAEALAGPRPITSPQAMARTSLEPAAPVAVIQPPTQVGAIGGAGLLLDLDDPLVREAAKRTTRDPSLRGGAATKIAVPAPIDAPFSDPSARPLVAAHVDAPFGAQPAPKKPRRDMTMPFGIAAKGEPASPAPLDDPFADVFGESAPLPLPEPARVAEPSGLFEIEMESVPPEPIAAPRPPPPAPPPRPPPPPRRPLPAPASRAEPGSDAEPAFFVPDADPEPASEPAFYLPDPEPASEPASALRDDVSSEPAFALPEPEPARVVRTAQPALAATQPAFVAPEITFAAPEPEPEPEPAPPPLAPRIADLPMAAAPAPLLMDVTPLTLSLETAGGFCASIVPRNAPLPAEKSRVFSTARDGQDAVEVRICQGESIQFTQNQLLGTLVLDGIRQAARGSVRIEITFLLDASGILDVRAVDLDTRREQRTRIALQGGIDAGEIEAMRQRQERELR